MHTFEDGNNNMKYEYLTTEKFDDKTIFGTLNTVLQRKVGDNTQ